MTRLLNFVDFALNRVEMKSVRGGDNYTCWCINSTGKVTGGFSYKADPSNWMTKMQKLHSKSGSCSGTNLVECYKP